MFLQIKHKGFLSFESILQKVNFQIFFLIFSF